jgi:hypothetical protein
MANSYNNFADRRYSNGRVSSYGLNNMDQLQAGFPVQQPSSPPLLPPVQPSLHRTFTASPLPTHLSHAQQAYSAQANLPHYFGMSPVAGTPDTVVYGDMINYGGMPMPQSRPSVAYEDSINRYVLSVKLYRDSLHSAPSFRGMFFQSVQDKQATEPLLFLHESHRIGRILQYVVGLEPHVLWVLLLSLLMAWKYRLPISNQVTDPIAAALVPTVPYLFGSHREDGNPLPSYTYLWGPGMFPSFLKLLSDTGRRCELTPSHVRPTSVLLVGSTGLKLTASAAVPWRTTRAHLKVRCSQSLTKYASVRHWWEAVCTSVSTTRITNQLFYAHDPRYHNP